MFYGTGTRPEKVLTKNIRRVRDLEDKRFSPRAMATYAFFAITFFSDINFFLKFYSAKRRTKRAKIMRKTDRSPCSFKRNQSLIDLVLKGNLLGSDCVRARARLMTQEIMCST